MNLLEVEGLRAGFGSTTVLHGVDFGVREGSVVALLGLNGAGKSVTLKCVSGLIGAWAGSIKLAGRELRGLDAEDRVRAGLGHVLQARALFPALTVEQNLRIGGATLRGRRAWCEARDRMFSLYPILADRRHRPAGALSGGEQEMLAVARALMSSPRLLLVDEPSAGLAPVMVHQLVDTLQALKASGATILLVEQNVPAALRIADEVLVLQKGAIAYAGPSASLVPEELAGLLGIGPLLGASAGPPARRRRTAADRRPSLLRVPGSAT